MIDYQINPKYKSLEKAILDIPRRFDREGEVIDNKRNVLRYWRWKENVLT